MDRGLRGLDRVDLPSGDRYLKLHHYADPDKGDAWLERVRREMSGTPHQFNQQILMLDNQSEGALWNRDWFAQPGFRQERAFGKERGAMTFRPPVTCERIVVALDPSVTDPERRKSTDREPDACGVAVCGVTADLRFIVLGEFSAVMRPGEWARMAVQLFALSKANAIVYEANQGGELIPEVIRGIASGVPLVAVHAAQGKRPRAEAVAMLYENGQASHCGPMDDLENEMVTWDARDLNTKSPNRVDAVVWGAHGVGLCLVTGTRVSTRLRTRG